MKRPVAPTLMVSVESATGLAAEGRLRIRIGTREETAAFLEFVGSRHDVVVTRVYPPLAPAVGPPPADEFELTVVASLNESALHMEVALLVRAWEAARRSEGKDATVAVVEPRDPPP